jgi:hypothetical protein
MYLLLVWNLNILNFLVGGEDWFLQQDMGFDFDFLKNLSYEFRSFYILFCK